MQREENLSFYLCVYIEVWRKRENLYLALILTLHFILGQYKCIIHSGVELMEPRWQIHFYVSKQCLKKNIWCWFDLLSFQGQERSKFFSVFYLSINAGSLISTFLTPVLRGQCWLTTWMDDIPPDIVALQLPSFLTISHAWCGNRSWSPRTSERPPVSQHWFRMKVGIRCSMTIPLP